MFTEALVSKYGTGSFKQDQTKEILQYAFNYYTERLVGILNRQTELRFYQAIFFLHEITCHFTTEFPNQSPVSVMNPQDYAIYSRVLKLCLEHACEVDIKFEHSFGSQYLNEIDATLEQILYIGAEAYYL